MSHSTPRGGAYTLWWIAGILFILLAAGVAWKAWPLLFPKPVLTAPRDDTCNLHQTRCRVTFADGAAVTLSLTPRPIPVLKMLTLEVRVDGVEAQSVAVDFTGVDMYMGYNRPQLQAAAAGQFRGQGVLPVCTVQTMQWEAKVLVETAQGIYLAPFRFEVVKK